MVRTTVVFAAALLAGIHILAGNKPHYNYIIVRKVFKQSFPRVSFTEEPSTM